MNIRTTIFICVVIMIGVIYAGTNYNSQQIDNFTFWMPDSSQKVHISSISGTVTLNVTTLAAPDTATYFRSDTTSTKITILAAAHFSNRYQFTVSGLPADTFSVQIRSWRVDSTTVYPGGHFQSNYLDPSGKDTIVIQSRKKSGVISPQFESEGR